MSGTAELGSALGADLSPGVADPVDSDSMGSRTASGRAQPGASRETGALEAPTKKARNESVEVSDAELMAKLASGDLEALGLLVERHQHSLVNYLFRLTQRKDYAEELAQEAFLKVYESVSRYRERGVFSAYLFRIATNLLRSEQRRSSRWRTLLPFVARHAEMAHGGAGASPQRLALREEVTTQVEQALDALPIHYRAAVVLREIEGWSYAEIALALRCRPGTVKSRIYRAKAQLKEKLHSYWQE